MTQSRWLRRVGLLVALAAVYVIAGKLGLKLAFENASATPVWPCTGIALAAFVLLGYDVWPAVLAGSFLVNITTAGSVATALGIAAGKDRKSTRLNSSHSQNSYAVFCLEKKKYLPATKQFGPEGSYLVVR